MYEQKGYKLQTNPLNQSVKRHPTLPIQALTLSRRINTGHLRPKKKIKNQSYKMPNPKLNPQTQKRVQEHGSLTKMKTTPD